MQQRGYGTQTTILFKTRDSPLLFCFSFCPFWILKPFEIAFNLKFLVSFVIQNITKKIMFEVILPNRTGDVTKGQKYRETRAHTVQTEAVQTITDCQDRGRLS